MEYFLFLGHQQNTYFFIHVVHNEDTYKGTTAGHLLNCLINETMVTTADKTCVVYDVYKDKITVTSIQHVDRVFKARYDIETLQDQLTRLVTATRPPEQRLLAFGYNPDRHVFITYETVKKPFPQFTITVPIKEPVVYIETSKPLQTKGQ